MDITTQKRITSEFPDLFQNSILSILFAETENLIWDQMVFQECHDQWVLEKEGAASDGLYVILKGQVDLVRGSDQPSGSVAAYRSINTYSSLRQEPSTYTAKMRGAGAVLFIPNSVLEKAKSSNSAGYEYLLKITEDIEYRKLALSFDRIGCSQKFKVAFISSLDSVVYPPQTQILSMSSTNSQVFYTLEGECLVERPDQDSKKVSRWTAPSRTWLNWAQAVRGRPTTFSVRSISRLKVLTIEAEELKRLQQDHRSDFERFDEYIGTGEHDNFWKRKLKNDTDLTELFEASKSSKISWWQAYPWVMQSDEMDCGAACLAMMSKAYGRNVPIHFWRNVLSTNRQGTTLFDLALTSEKNGFINSAVEVEEIEDLEGSLPCIALRKSHYVVVYKILKDDLIIGDPATGVMKMSIDEFEEGFENFALLMKPTEAFDSLPVQKTRYWHFISLLGEVKAELVISFFISLLMIGLGLGGPLLSQIFFDDVLVRKDLNWMWITFAIGIFIAICESSLAWAKTYYDNHISIKIDFKMNSILLKKVIDLPYTAHTKRHSGDFMMRFEELGTIKSFLLHTSEDLVLSICSVVVYSMVLFVYAPIVAIFAFASLPLFALISWLAGKRLVRIDQKVFRESAETESSLMDTIKGIAAIKSLGGELAARWRYEEKLVSLLKTERQYELTAESINVVFNLYSSFVKYSIVAICIYLAILGELTAGQVLATTMIAFGLFSPLIQLTEKFGEIQHVFAVLDRVNDILFIQGDSSSNQGVLKPDTFLGEIEFRDVWFRYGSEGSPWVLQGVNFKVDAKQKVAIVGPNGSGKSTIAGLLNRMFEPTKGQIFIDGRNYLDYDIQWLRQKVGILQQESPLFAGTIMENIAFSSPEFSLTDVAEAARKANAEEFIQKKPNGHNYHISQGGLGLSSGEKQRVGLARTLYNHPKILILDEATSTLDGQSESQLLEKIRADQADATILNIAHRYTAARACEVAIVISSGKVVGMGTHEDLAQNNEVYQKLFSVYIETEIANKLGAA